MCAIIHRHNWKCTVPACEHSHRIRVMVGSLGGLPIRSLTVNLNREYEREAAVAATVGPFPRWLSARCSLLPDGAAADMEDLRALSHGPSTRVCSFRSMVSHGSHYRVEEEEGSGSHVTYDCGVAELQARSGGGGCLSETNGVELRRVGTLKDILVLNYGTLNRVLMAVSWLTEHTELQPRLRRDAHGFWLANMAAIPRSSQDPYILPSLASQVQIFFCRVCYGRSYAD